VSVSAVAALAGRLAAAEVLSEPSYRRLWLSGLCVNAARWMDLLVVGWLALSLTGSPFMVGLAAFARAAPLMVVGPFAGIVADRVARGRVLVAAQCVGLATALALAAIFSAGAGGYWPLVALEIVFGAMWALARTDGDDEPARRRAWRHWSGGREAGSSRGWPVLGARGLICSGGREAGSRRGTAKPQGVRRPRRA
jgi:MFS family permease